MCGIAGIFDLSGKDIDRRILHRMDEAIAHRGPDGHGEYIDGFVGLANRRLAIIDPGKSGNQPIGTRDKKHWITFNGEIFNYQILRAQLLKKGYSFQTHTDTEVVLLGYIEWGDAVVQKLIGQFAFGIWDKEKKQLFLARDHIGVNPLFYSSTGTSFLFSSELKGILASGLVQKTINPQALHHYLSLFSIPAPLTIIDSVYMLLPGHAMTVSARGVTTRKYWDVPVWRGESFQKSEAEVKDELRSHLLSAVKDATVADVPVGAFLSGGLDSSSVVALMATQTKAKIKTFSLWAEGGAAFDERNYARIVADRFGTDHTECEMSEQEIFDDFPKIICSLDQPTGGSFETYFISKYAGRQTKVALSGLGGDELFAGYHAVIHQWKYASAVYRHAPKSVRRVLVAALGYLSPSADMKKTLEHADAFLSLSDAVQQRLFYHIVFSEEEKNNLYSSQRKRTLSVMPTGAFITDITNALSDCDAIDRLSYLDLHSYTRDDLLLGMNMTGMYNGLETRVPLLDHRLITYASTLPPYYKYRDGVTKYILREVMKEWLPKEILEHKKVGFGVPRIRYMRGILKPMILEVLSEKSVRKRGIFNPAYVRSLLTILDETNEKMLWREHLRIWILFVFELWMREFIDS